MDQLQAIRVFARVVETGSFTRAADSLQMPKATVTKLVQGLESHLHARLLQRTTRRVTVTPEGAAYYEHTARLLGELDDIDAGLTRAQTRPRGRLRVDIGSSLASVLLVPALPDFHARYPDIQLSLGVSDRRVDLIGESVDCVIRGGALNDQSLVARRLARLAWVTCATPAYLERFGTPDDPRQLQEDHRLINYFSARSGRVLPMHFSRGDDHFELDGPAVLSVNESNAHLAAILAGLGVGQTFRFLAAPHIASGALVPILQDWQHAPHEVHLLYPPNRHLSARLRAFIDWAVVLFGRLD